MDKAKQEAQSKLKGVDAVRKNIEKIQTLMNKLEVEINGIAEKQIEMNKTMVAVKKNNLNNSLEISGLEGDLGKNSKDFDVALETIKNQAKVAKKYLIEALIEMAQLHEQRKLLNDLKGNLVESKNYIEAASSDIKNIYEKLITIVKELTIFVSTLPLSEKDLLEIEREMNTAEQNLKYDRKIKKKLEENDKLFDLYSEEVEKVKKDVSVMKKISESLESLGNETYCVRVFEPKR